MESQTGLDSTTVPTEPPSPLEQALEEGYDTFFGRLEAQEASSFYETQWKQIAISWMTPEELRVVQQVYEDTISQKTVALGEFLCLRETVMQDTDRP